MSNPLTKLNRYASTTLAMARYEDMNPVLASSRVFAAYARYGLDLSMVSYARLIRRPESEYGDFVPPAELFPIQFRLNTDEAKQIVKDKLRFHQVCVERGIPTPTIHGCITSDRDLALYGVARVSRGADLQRAVEPHEGQRLLLKPQHGIFGTGVHRITMIGDRVVHDDGTAETCDAFIERFVSEATPYLIQELVEPHERLRPILASGALGTFRIVTVLRGGRASIVGACLKIPRGSNVADNFQNGTTGNLLAGVDIESGRLLHIVGPRPGDVRVPVVLDTHPDTGARVTGFEIPQWNALCEMTRRAAEQIPGLVTGGWDVAVSSGGPTVIEANWRYNIYILQIANQSGVRQSLMSALQSALTAHA